MEIKNFLPNPGLGHEPIPIRAAMTDSHETIVVLFEINHKQGIACLTTSHKEPTDFLVQDILPQSSFCLIF